MDLDEALAAWSAFPVHADPRPLIVTGPLLHEAGYVSSEAKNALPERRLEFADGVPAAAVASLAAEIGPLVSRPGYLLRVLGATRVRYAFRTDRGPRELDAWSFDVRDSIGTIIVVDADERARMWPDPRRGFGAGTAHHLDPSGTRLQYRFVGSPRRYDDYDGVDVATSETAVAVSLRRTSIGRDDGIRLAYAETREVEVCLPAPLGARVLVSASGSPIEVSG